MAIGPRAEVVRAIEAGNRERRAQLRRENLPPRLVNMAAALASEVTALDWKGIYLRIPPVPYREGLRLEALRMRGLQLQHDMEALADRIEEAEKRGERDVDAEQERFLGLQQEEAIHDEACRIMKRLVRPRALHQRIAWKLLPNPFRDASAQEMAELFSFFLICRTKSRIRSSGAQVDAPSSTQETGSLTSPATSRPGRKGRNPSAGDTTR